MTKLFSLLITIVVLTTSCSGVKKVSYDNLNLDLSSVKNKKLYLALLDHRSQVIEQTQHPEFIGTTTNIIGFKKQITNTGDVIEDFSANIVKSLQSNKNKIYSINTSPSDSEEIVNGKLFKNNWGKKILIVFDDFYTKGYGRQILYYNFRVLIYDKDNMLLVQKKFEGNKKLGGSILLGLGKYDEYLPESVVSLFDTIFREEEIVRALQ